MFFPDFSFYSIFSGFKKCLMRLKFCQIFMKTFFSDVGFVHSSRTRKLFLNNSG